MKFSDDRLFVYLRLQDDDTHDRSIQSLIEAGQPVICLDLDDPYDLGGEIFHWEMATVVAGYCLGINPFDQPDVEAAKILARNMVEAYQQQGRLPALEPTYQTGDIAIFTDAPVESLEEALTHFFDRATTEDDCSYIALQVYVKPDQETTTALQALRLDLRDRTCLATTLGYGPRFLHSTGQLHKGDAGHGLFIQFTSDAVEDVEIPDAAGSSDSNITFGILKTAQALGDRQALLDNRRQVLRIHLGKDARAGLEQVRRALT